MIAPNTNIRLLKTPMELNDANTLSFASETDKYNYFNSLPKLSLDGATYQRKEGVLRYPTTSSDTFEDLLQYNYCMYQNASYDNKWFYAYIDDIKYINDGMTELKLRTDTFMTWQNDIVYKQSFIERQHVNDDTFGLHTIPENLELGEMTCNAINKPAEADLNLNVLIVMALNKPLATLTDTNNTQMYGGVFSGLYYVAFHTSTDCSKCIQALDRTGYGSMVENIFILPNKLLNITTWNTVYFPDDPQQVQFDIAPIPNSNTATRFIKDAIITRNSTINGYTPKNNKLFCFPYNYMLVSNNSGQQAIFQYEDFLNGNGDFDIVGTIGVGGSIRIIPRNYKGLGSDLDPTACNSYGLTGSKYPTCSWVNDSYTNWLTQNSVNLTTDILLGGGKAIVGTVSGNPQGVVSGFLGMFDVLKQMHNAEFLPNQAKGSQNSGDIQYSAKMMHFDIYQMSIKQEYARVIDNFFTMYGYKVNSLEVINIHKRTYFDFIKTISCNIIGNIPQKDLEEIRNLFDNGLTIWHNPSYFLDYSVNNTIIT